VLAPEEEDALGVRLVIPNPRKPGLGSESRPPVGARRVAREQEFSDAVRATAAVIRQTYVDDRSVWESMRRGVPYRYVCPPAYDKGVEAPPTEEAAAQRGRRSKAVRPRPPVWLTLAAKFIAREIDPVDYVHRLFERLEGRYAPEPAQLLGGGFVEQYQRVQELEEESLLPALISQKQTALANVVYYQGGGADFVTSHAMTLLDDSLELSALFRVCLADSLMGRDPIFCGIVRTYMRQAAVQFHRNRNGYRKAWGAFIPAGFVTRSRRLFREALGYGRGRDGDWSDGHEEEG
jgi:hypothetical protein